MKKSIQLNRSEGGFTLLEVIVTIVIAAILGSLLFTFMGTGITKSAVPLNQTRALGTSIGNIETITAAYASYLSATKSLRPDLWVTFKAAWGCSGNSGTACTNTLPIVGYTYTPKFETIQVERTSGDQKIISYFMN